MKKTHELKILKFFADAIVVNNKTFEVRKNDRKFQIGDIITFNCIDESGMPLSHPIHEREYEIIHILNGYGIEKGYVALGIREIEKEMVYVIIVQGIEIYRTQDKEMAEMVTRELNKANEECKQRRMNNHEPYVDNCYFLTEEPMERSERSEDRNLNICELLQKFIMSQK